MNHDDASKEAKEAFVSGHSGTSELEILLICSACPIGIFAYRTLALLSSSLLLSSTSNSNSNSKKLYDDDYDDDWRILAVIEMICIIFPMVICQTVFLYDFGVYWLMMEILVGSLLMLLISRLRRSNHNELSIISLEQLCKDAMTMYRSCISVLTFIAILAVDFHVFPRRLAKTETQGCGLMDLGAASFVMANAFCSKYARLGNSNIELSSLSLSLPSYYQIGMKSIPIISLGFVRLLTTKGLEYQEHVSEYGIYWNFYFTLAFLTTIIPLIFRKCSRKVRLVISFMLILSYQIFLSLFHGQEFVEYSSRSCPDRSQPTLKLSSFTSVLCTFFVANREGILGCIGYTVLFLVSEEISLLCIWQQVKTSKDARRKKKDDDISTNGNDDGNERSIALYEFSQIGLRLGVINLIIWSCYYFCTQVLRITVSRRSTNLSFVIWTFATNVLILFLIWIVFYVSVKYCHCNTPSSPIFSAVNRNGLLIFLIANLLTGLVNLSINTLQVSDLYAVPILLCYLGITGSFALILDKILNISVKLG